MAANSFIQTDIEQNRIQSFAFVIGACAAVCFCIGFATSSLVRFERTFGACEVELEERINPNDAPSASLVRLPGIGVSRAAAIVAYREDFSEQNGSMPAFQNCNDLQRVKGIGPKTAQNISGWLKFE